MFISKQDADATINVRNNGWVHGVAMLTQNRFQ